MKKKNKKRIGKVQGFALLYGRSSRAIRIVNGEEIGRVVNQHRSTKKKSVMEKPVQKKHTNGVKADVVENQRPSSKKKSGTEKQVRKKYVMDENTQKRLDRLQDPLDMISRNARAQKYEAAKGTEQYEYGLSDW